MPLHVAFDAATEDIEDRLQPVNDILADLPFGPQRDRLKIVLRRLNPVDVAEFRRELKLLSSGITEVLSDEQAESRFRRLRKFIALIRKPKPGTRPTVNRDVYLDVRKHVEITAIRLDSTGRPVREYLFRRFRGHHHLVFANSRSNIEQLADRLTPMSQDQRVPLEFFPHHGNLSQDEREHVERRLKNPSTPTTAICTSTLEMGIDIGAVHAVAQIGAPPGVASLRQRMGRSGRVGSLTVLDVHVAEEALTATINPVDELRIGLVQTVAMLELMDGGWLEPPDLSDLHLSTLTQQVLSVVAQHGGASAGALHTLLCRDGPFHRVTPPMFARLLRLMGNADLLVQGAAGLLLAGGLGDRDLATLTRPALRGPARGEQELTEPRRTVRLGITPFAVLDVETTGLDFIRDRVLEVAVVRLLPEGTITDTWDTLVNPQRSPGSLSLARC